MVCNMYEPAQVDIMTILLTLFIGAFCATCFLLGSFFPKLIKPFKFPTSDKFDLGYIEDREVGMTLPLVELFEDEIPTARKTRQKITPRPKPKAKVQPKPKAKVQPKPKAKSTYQQYR